MLGDLFYRGSSPTEIESMSYRQLKYWHDWCVLMNQAEKDAQNPKK